MLRDAPTVDDLAPDGVAGVAPVGPSARGILDAARSLAIPRRRWGPQLVQLGQGRHQRLLPVAEAEPGSGAADRAALASAGLPVSESAGGSVQVLVVGWRAIAASGRAPRAGAWVDHTPDLRVEDARLAERAADVLGLDVANVEVDRGGVVSVTRGPRLDWHPARARPAALAILAQLFPPGVRTRIPLVVVCDGAPVAACLAELLGRDGCPVGVADDARVLSHPHVGTAVISRATRRSRAPLGFDRADVVVVGAGCAVEAVLPVVRRLPRDGTLVVPADHPGLHRLRIESDARVVVVALQADHPVLEAVSVSGGAVAWVTDDDAVVVRQGGRPERVCEHFSRLPLPAGPDDALAAVVAEWTLEQAHPFGCR